MRRTHGSEEEADTLVNECQRERTNRQRRERGDHSITGNHAGRGGGIRRGSPAVNPTDSKSPTPCLIEAPAADEDLHLDVPHHDRFGG